MSKPMLTFGAAIVFVVSTAAASKAATVGNLTVGGGGVWPQQKMAYYTDPGPHVFGRVDLQIPEVRMLMLWAGLGGTFFKDDDQRVYIETTGDPIPVNQSTTQTALTFHLGAQLGSHSRRGFFRPRAGAGIGLYSLQTNTDWKWTDEEEAFSSEDRDSQLRIGWRGFLGADFFPTPKWGIGAEFVTDQIWNVDQDAGDAAEEGTAIFHGFAVNFVLPLESIIE